MRAQRGSKAKPSRVIAFETLNGKFIKKKSFISLMSTETVEIPKDEYLRLKKLEEVDQDLLNQLASSLEDVKAGRIKRVI